MKCRSKLSWLLLCTILIGLFFSSTQEVSAATVSKYLKVNNTTLAFAQVIYLDSTSGNDTTGDGSKDKPFKTVVKGFDYLNVNCREGGAIVIKDGTYDVGDVFAGTSNNMNSRYNGLKISVFAETLGKVNFTNVGEWMMVENSLSARVKVSLYGIVFSNLRGQSHYHLGGDDWTNEYYNCVFIAGYGGWNGSVKTANIKTENCLFVGAPNSSFTTTNPLAGSAINCASTTQYIDPYGGTKTSCLYNVTLDSDYNITSLGWENAGTGTNPDGTVANIGVYGGQYAWGSKVSEVVGNSLIIDATPGNAKVILTWSNISNATSYNIKRSTTLGGPYVTVANSLSNSFTDIGLLNGTTYYYVVSAITAAGESDNSNIATATPTATVLYGNAILVITMDNGAIKEYNLTGEELTDFLTWYDSHPNGAVNAYFIFNVKNNVAPFKSIKNYIPYNKILYFDVKEYD